MFQSFLSPIRSRFENVKPQNVVIADANDPLSPRNSGPASASVLSPRSPLAWGVASPALSVFGAIPVSASSGTDREDLANAEEFARDVLVELMRGLLDDLRTQLSSDGKGISQDGVQTQIRVLSEIRRVMQQDVASLNSAPDSMAIINTDEPRTKAVFRELDGFLSLLSALSPLSASSATEVITEECVCLVFLVLAEALSSCMSNQVYFQTKVGWESFGEALEGLLTGSMRKQRLLILSHLLSLAIEYFEAPFDAFFSFVEETDLEVVDQRISEVRALKESLDAEGRRLVIRHASAICLLWNFVHNGAQRQTRYALYKVLEVLFGACHRNGCMLSSLAIVGDVFKGFQEARLSLKATNDHQDPKESDNEQKVLEKEKHVLQRLLRRLLEMGANTAEARRIFQAAVINEGGKEMLDAEILELIRSGMKSRWVEHFSLEGKASIVISDEYKWKTLPKEGMSLLMWFYTSTMPTGETKQLLFSAESMSSSSPNLFAPQSQVYAALSLLPDGRLKIYTSAAPDEEGVFASSQSKVRCARWTHLAFVWYPRMGGHPNLRLYLDGVFVEGMQLPYPRSDALLGSTSSVQYNIGDSTSAASRGNNSSWCLASAYLLGFPLPSDIPRLIHHLGPRYTGSFQDPGILKFLTYEAATSLNMYLATSSALPLTTSPTRGPPSTPWFNTPTVSTAITNKPGQNSMLKALREGLQSVGIREEVVLFGVGPSSFPWGFGTKQSYNTSGFRSRRHSGSWSDRDNSKPTGQKTVLLGDVFVVKAESLDDALWKCGGAAVGLRFVDLAETPHELSRALGILTDGLKNSWQNSEDMERMRGYDILDAILRRKAHLINLTAFETLFEFFGLNFSVPEQSTIVNPLAYKAIALDFSLWAKTGLATLSAASSDTKLKIPLVHLDHFTTLLKRSRYRVFNWAVGLGEGFPQSKKDADKAGSRGGKGGRGTSLVRKMLFALQMGWYAGISNKSQQADEEQDMTQYLIDALGVVLRAPGGFGKDDIKAVVAYLAANLIDAEDVGRTSAPSMAVSPTEVSNGNNLQVHQEGGHADGVTTPQSTASRFSFTVSFKNLAVTSQRANADKILELLVQILSKDLPDTAQHSNNQASYYHKFTTSLPMNRILLLLLGERPTSHSAACILRLIGVGVMRSPSFTRKFELVSGWNVLKVVLSNVSVWDIEVDGAAWDLLLGKTDAATGSRTSTPTSANTRKEKQKQRGLEVSCPHILATILCALRTGLEVVASRSTISDDDEQGNDLSWTTESLMERLIERMLTLHTSSGTFRQAFESQQTTQLFIDAYNAMVEKLTRVLVSDPDDGHGINGWNVRILEKLSHFGLALALDNAVSGLQKQEILGRIRSAETILNPGATSTSIDPNLVADNRSVKQRLASARFSAVPMGDRAVFKTMTRIVEWRVTVQTSEKKRLRKTMLDLREFRRQISRLTNWTNLLTSERALWPRNEECLWRLDETEGPHRIRKKLEYQTDNSPSSRVDSLDEITRDVRPPEVESASFVYEVPPWAESYEISATEIEEQQQLAEEIMDDKLRRVRHELEPGDVIEAVATVARVDGVDTYPGLLIFGRTHIYMLDGVVENDQGEVIDTQDAPKNLFFIPGSRIELSGPQKARRWPHSQMSSYSEKKFLFRDVALEIYFKDSRSLLIVFLDKKKRTDFENRLSSTVDRPQLEIGATPSSAPRSQSFVKMGTRLLSGFRLDELSTATRKWQARELSNFAYLSILNAISGRTPSDATQYPIFPWVLSDYTSQTLDLNDPASYRDLTKPMGALTAARRQAAETRYTSLQGVDEEPFHYGTHFSSSMIVCHFLIRLAPFTHMFKTLQGGDWDLPDRLFSDLRRAYESAAIDVRGDVRELIPEFFTCPEFLENSANHDFGILQQTGEKIHDVKLPPWARQDPLLFIVMNRRALESSIVSEQLPAWIDLIWGCNQRDPASLNVFHPLSYEGSIDLDSIKDDLERDATVGIIHNFGQTPRKLFSNPHPVRDKHGLHSLPVGLLRGIEEDPHLLTQHSRCFRDHGPSNAVRGLVPDPVSGKVISLPEGVLCLPQYPYEHVEWRPGSTELRVVLDDKVVQVIENAFCTCATFADATCLVTGSSDYTVRLWKVSRGQQGIGSNGPPSGGSSGMRLAPSHIMRVHIDEVVCVAASRPWSMVVSGSKDGSAALWDLNKGVYVRSIWHAEGGSKLPMDLVAINDSTGYIATCSRNKLCLHTINARPIAVLDLTTTPSFSSLVPTITAMAFHEREYSPLGVLATGGPDGSITLSTWTADGTAEGEKAKWEFLTIRTMKARNGGLGRPPAVTALQFLGENLYHGEETGKSYMWNLTSN